MIVHDDIDLALEDLGASRGASGAHGVIAGLACAGTEMPPARLHEILNDELEAELDEEGFRALRQLDGLVRRQLSDASLSFDLLLPDDSAAIGHRVRHLAEWCDGFLSGFGTGSAGRRDRDFPPDVRELLDAIAEISRAEVDAADGDEDAERNYMEIVEFLRMAALTIFLEVAAPRDGGAPGDSILH